MLLQTERLQIRFIKSDDWQSIKEIWTDFAGSQFAQYDVPHSTEEENLKERTAKWAEVSGGREHMFFAICLKDTMIGYVDFHQIEDGYEIGYCFHSHYYRKGYAKESLMALKNFAKENGAKRLVAGTAINNYPSVRLLESVKFEKIADEKVTFYQDENGDDIYFDGGVFELKL